MMDEKRADRFNVFTWSAAAFGIAAILAIAVYSGRAFLILHKPVNWTLVAALGTFAAAAFALASTFVNAGQAIFSRLALGVNALLEFDRQFNGSDYRDVRKTACEMLRDGKPVAETDKALEDVFDFFETIGLMTRRRALDQEMVWSTFFYWLHGYWLVAEEFIERQQTKAPARYGDLRWLHDMLVPIEERKRGTLDRAEWEDFLTEEIDQ